MNPIVYNVCVLLGVAMIGAGTAIYSVPASLIVTGAILVTLTLAAAKRSGRL